MSDHVVKMNGNDRILKLTKREKRLNTFPGLIGEEVFTGKNNLHAVYKEDLGLWYLKLEKGAVPEGLKQQWTSFSALMKHTKLYFDGKAIDVKEE